MYNTPISHYASTNAFQRQNPITIARKLLEKAEVNKPLTSDSIDHMVLELIEGGYSPNYAAFVVKRYIRASKYSLGVLTSDVLLDVKSGTTEPLNSEMRVNWIKDVIVPVASRVLLIKADSRLDPAWCDVILLLHKSYPELIAGTELARHFPYDHSHVKELVYGIFPAMRLKLPLEIGVGDRIVQQLKKEGLSDEQTAKFMSIYCQSLRYLDNSMRSVMRYNEHGLATMPLGLSERAWAARRYLTKTRPNKKNIDLNTKQIRKSRKLASSLIREFEDARLAQQQDAM